VLAAEDLIAEQQGDHEFQDYVFDLVGAAQHFQMSWDQALSPEQGEELNTQLDRIFLLEITPNEFAEAMNATIAS
jgi:raffinose/stachyose/melibiose transport system substrate-binding protein